MPRELQVSTLAEMQAERAFAFLARLENHWELSDRFELRSLDPDGQGAQLRVRGPLGLRRDVVTRVERVDAPRTMEGSARSGSSRGRVRWQVVPLGPHGSELTLTLVFDRLTPVERVLATLVWPWLHRELQQTVRAAAQHAASTPPDVV